MLKSLLLSKKDLPNVLPVHWDISLLLSVLMTLNSWLKLHPMFGHKPLDLILVMDQEDLNWLLVSMINSEMPLMNLKTLMFSPLKH